jgi:hypothetical protein
LAYNGTVTATFLFPELAFEPWEERYITDYILVYKGPINNASAPTISDPDDLNAIAVGMFNIGRLRILGECTDCQLCDENDNPLIGDMSWYLTIGNISKNISGIPQTLKGGAFTYYYEDPEEQNSFIELEDFYVPNWTSSSTLEYCDGESCEYPRVHIDEEDITGPIYTDRQIVIYKGELIDSVNPNIHIEGVAVGIDLSQWVICYGCCCPE